jgi:hypothetical protein
MSDNVPAHHTAEHWAQRRRSLDDFVVKTVEDHGDSVTLCSTKGWCFNRVKSDLERTIHTGERLRLETIGISQITGLRDAYGWLFHLSDQDLADKAHEFSEDLHRKDVVRLERNRQRYAEQEAALPEWLQARILRFREGGGEHFLLTGWGYELMICRLADLLDRGLDAEADKLVGDEGASGNQWDCAKTLARGRKEYGDDFGRQLPAGISPITGSADYS